MKNLLFFLMLYLMLMWSCNPSEVNKEYIYLSGEAQGTTFSIAYLHPTSRNLASQVDSILIALNKSLSIYEDSSVIRNVNDNKTDILDPHLYNVLKRGQSISEETNGAFDMTVMPLVSAWGFGNKRKQNMDKHIVDSLLSFVGYKRIQILDYKIVKEDPRTQVDVNAIAQGYSVDVIALFLESEGVQNYMVEIGGEVRTKGINARETAWQIGIDKPIEDSLATQRELQVILSVSGVSVATSGNYRKFYQDGDKKISHTINPKTGYPARGGLLSATVVANDCMSADAYATACMVMQLDSALHFVSNQLGLSAYFIYSDDNGNIKTAQTKNFDLFISRDK